MYKITLSRPIPITDHYPKTSTLRQIYCISGLGADERIFSKLKLPGIALIPLQWILPVKNELIGEYAARMLDQVPAESPCLLGVSFGGMMAIEMAKSRPGTTVILVSSIKSRQELPLWMKWCGNLKLYRMIPRNPRRFVAVEDRFLGAETDEERNLVAAFRESSDPVYLHWAIGQILTWRNEWQPSTLYHLHGTTDRTFPVKRIRATHVVPGGGHFMIMNRAAEINAMLMEILGEG